MDQLLEQGNSFVEAWKQVDRVQRRLKRRNITSVELEDAFVLLDGNFRAAIKKTAPRTSSGLVEFQRILSKRT